MSAAGSLRTVAGLVKAGLVVSAKAPALEAVAARYAIALTPSVTALIDPAHADDPIARQFVPRAEELVQRAEERADPIGDAAHSPIKGLVHRYPDRVLLKLTHTCPVYCRFCFRREMVGPGGDGALTEAEIAAALAYVAERPAIREVIITGGDPFVLSARRVRDVTAKIAAIATIDVIRWHSRVPVVQPETITAEFVRSLTAPAGGKAVFVAVHANHAREFSDAARIAIARLADAGVVLVSQSVLLRGVNDSVEALSALMRACLANRIKPYYLHHGDLAPGTSHFRVPMAEGLALVKALRGTLSGLAQPAYVIDLPGGYGKVPVQSGMLRTDGRFEFRDHGGALHLYPPVV